MSWLTTSARRVLWLVVLGAAGGMAFTWWRERQDPTGPIDPPEWPPIGADLAAEPAAESVSSAVRSDPAAFVNALVDSPDARSTETDGAWTSPNADGTCPDGYPIKANDNSGIYHVPSGRFYDRTKAERCYATAEAAEADGYRAAKS